MRNKAMKVKPDRLKEIVIHILKGLHAAEEEAAVVAEALIKAELRGIDTHGVHLLTLLPERVEAGILKIPTKLTVLQDSGATALLDGGNGLGQAAVHRTMGMSVRKAISPSGRVLAAKSVRRALRSSCGKRKAGDCA